MNNACRSVIPGPGSVAPIMPTFPKMSKRNRQATAAPRSWAPMYPGTRFQGKSPRAAKAILTAGLRWAPETAPMNRMMAMTMRPGATTAATRSTPPKLTAETTPAPAATVTSRNVPKNSPKSLLHSSRGSSNHLRLTSNRQRRLVALVRSATTPGGLGSVMNGSSDSTPARTVRSPAGPPPHPRGDSHR